MNSIEKLILSMDNIYDVLTALEKIGFVTDLPLESDEGIGIEQLGETKGIDIELDKLCFKYSDANKLTLDNISLKINKGEKICIAGYNGSGKSTLVQLLGGLYNSYQGMISFNGLPLKSLKLESLRQRIGSLSTQDEIFNASILENIHLGLENVTMQQIVDVARKIDLHEFINRLPDGYQTELIGNGLNIPRSVRTKIILARTLICRPGLLLLDSFMPRIEPEEKEHIIDFLTTVKNPWTLVAISNNPAFAKRCDRVIVLQEGKLIADGHFTKVIKDKNVKKVFQAVKEGGVEIV